MCCFVSGLFACERARDLQAWACSPDADWDQQTEARSLGVSLVPTWVGVTQLLESLPAALQGLHEPEGGSKVEPGLASGPSVWCVGIPNGSSAAVSRIHF